VLGRTTCGRRVAAPQSPLNCGDVLFVLAAHLCVLAVSVIRAPMALYRSAAAAKDGAATEHHDTKKRVSYVEDHACRELCMHAPSSWDHSET
jgi:hypothetical protein